MCPRLFVIVEFLFAGSEQVRGWPDRLKVFQQRNIIFLYPHDVVIIRVTRARSTREGVAVWGKGPAHIFTGGVDGVAKIQRFLPFAFRILVGNLHIVTSSRSQVRASAGDKEALAIL